ncbi:MAG TPA: IS66 family insertion sequence element accessory protein TnpB [Alicyclobacillus sp.]|nr:IS66 family insertion sequence element accessory protein TnpB [Alicyclobacillus sp.]
MLENPGQRVYLACGSTDLRKSIDGHRKRDKLKILQWDHNGFWLHYRCLERGTFQWPDENPSGTLKINRRQLQWLLDGLSLNQSQAHREVTARTVL